MRFEHKRVFRLHGVVHKDEEEALLLDDEGRGVRAWLGATYSTHCDEADRSMALMTTMLRGFTGDTEDGDFEAHLSEEAAQIGRKRSSEDVKGPFLIIEVIGELEEYESRAERETESFIVQLNGAPTPELQDAVGPVVSALVCALAIAAEKDVWVDDVCRSTVFFREDGKRVYSFRSEVSAPRLSVSSGLEEDGPEKVELYFGSLMAEPTLRRVIRLYLTSLQQMDDDLRTFLAAWSALEIFVSKVFSIYETRWWRAIGDGSDSKAYQDYLARMSQVMKDKYRLKDRFSVVAVHLAPDDTDEDVGWFTEAKKMRDALMHGQEVDERMLPSDRVRRLLIKYLALHLTADENQAVPRLTNGPDRP